MAPARVAPPPRWPPSWSRPSPGAPPPGWRTGTDVSSSGNGRVEELEHLAEALGPGRLAVFGAVVHLKAHVRGGPTLVQQRLMQSRGVLDRLRLVVGALVRADVHPDR